MKLEFINTFLDAMNQIFTKMVGIEAKASTPSIKMGTMAYGDFSALIPLKSDKISGSAAITFPRPLLMKIAHRMLQDESIESDEELSDLVGELVNMAAGVSKNLLCDMGYDFDMATPELLTGSSHDIIHKVASQTYIIPFNTEEGQFHVELCFTGTTFK